MAHATPTRRSSYAPSTVSDLTSPPPSFSRRESTVSSVGATPNSERKRRNRTLLRDYYGLGQSTNRAPEKDQLDIGSFSPLLHLRLPFTLVKLADSPFTFSPDAYFTNLTSTASLSDLLKRENELLNGALLLFSLSFALLIVPVGRNSRA